MSEVENIDDGPQVEFRWFALVSLIGHVGLLVTAAWSLWNISGGWWLGAATAAVLVLLYATVWRFLLAPGSRRRLGPRERVTLTMVLAPVMVVIASFGGFWLPALIAGSFIRLGDALNQR